MDLDNNINLENNIDLGKKISIGEKFQTLPESGNKIISIRGCSTSFK